MPYSPSECLTHGKSDLIRNQNPFLDICLQANARAEQYSCYKDLVQETMSFVEIMGSPDAEACGNHMLTLITTVINHDKQLWDLIETSITVVIPWSSSPDYEH